MRTIQIGDAQLAVTNIFGVTKNFAEHAREMGGEVDSEPDFFMKSTTGIVPAGQAITLPSWSNNVHHEVEMVIAIGKDGVNISREDAMSYIAGYAIGIDLTARDVQNELKKGGRPWALSKGFLGAAVLSRFIPAAAMADPANIEVSLEVNGVVRQHGHTSQMVHDLPALIVFLSQRYGLQAGDLIYTGTPEGVGQLRHGDQVRLKLGDLIEDVREVV